MPHCTVQLCSEFTYTLHVHYYSQLKSKVGNILTKVTSLRITVTLTSMALRVYTFTHTHSPLPLTNLSPPIHFPQSPY
jgi:hypothetical protein